MNFFFVEVLIGGLLTGVLYALVALGFHEAQHPLLGQGTVFGVPAFELRSAH